MPQVTEFIGQYRRDWKGHNRRSFCRMPERDLKISSRRERKFGKTSEMMDTVLYL
jgi:hypothetical protein